MCEGICAAKGSYEIPGNKNKIVKEQLDIPYLYFNTNFKYVSFQATGILRKISNKCKKKVLGLPGNFGAKLHLASFLDWFGQQQREDQRDFEENH